MRMSLLCRRKWGVGSGEQTKREGLIWIHDDRAHDLRNMVTQLCCGEEGTGNGQRRKDELLWTRDRKASLPWVNSWAPPTVGRSRCLPSRIRPAYTGAVGALLCSGRGSWARPHPFPPGSVSSSWTGGLCFSTCFDWDDVIPLQLTLAIT